MSAAIEPIDSQICFALYAATHALTRAYRGRLAALGLTYPQYLTLLVLWEQDGLTVRTLARRLRIDSATLTPLLKRLEAAGFVRRRRSLEDERRVEVFLTEGAHAIRARVAEVQREVKRETGLDEAAYANLRRALNALVTGMSEEVAEPATADGHAVHGA
jgi:DNA-binding MarR family transcriptional regulator